MDFSQILDSIPIKTEEDILFPKFQLEDAEKIHPSFTLDNEFTYYLFLSKRPDLTQQERNIIYQIIARLKSNTEVEYSTMMKNMISADDFFKQERTAEVIFN